MTPILFIAALLTAVSMSQVQSAAVGHHPTPLCYATFDLNLRHYPHGQGDYLTLTGKIVSKESPSTIFCSVVDAVRSVKEGMYEVPCQGGVGSATVGGALWKDEFKTIGIHLPNWQQVPLLSTSSKIDLKHYPPFEQVHYVTNVEQPFACPTLSKSH